MSEHQLALGLNFEEVQLVRKLLETAQEALTIDGGETWHEMNALLEKCETVLFFQPPPPLPLPIGRRTTPLEELIIFHVDRGCDLEILVRWVYHDEQCTNDPQEIRDAILALVQETFLSRAGEWIKVTDSGWELWKTRASKLGTLEDKP